jgi:hypothetical protein
MVAQRDRLATEGHRISMEHLHWIDEEVSASRWEIAEGELASIARDRLRRGGGE